MPVIRHSQKEIIASTPQSDKAYQISLARITKKQFDTKLVRGKEIGATGVVLELGEKGSQQHCFLLWETLFGIEKEWGLLMW